MSEELKLDPQNVRAHPPRNVEMVRQSLEESGPFRGIGVDGDNIIRAGNLTYQQAIDLGYTVRVVEAAPNELIAVKRPDLRGREAERAALWDNASGDQAEWDAVALAELQQRDAALLEGVLGREELDGILAAGGLAPEPPADPGPQVDRAAELQESWGTALGQIWQLGNHRLVIGDSTSQEVRAVLIDNDEISLGIHDPPYGINLDQSWLSRLHRDSGKPPNVAADHGITGDDGTLDLSFCFEVKKWLVYGFPYIADERMSGWLVWDKWPGVEGGGLGNPVEMACTNLWKGFRLVRVMWGGYYRAAGEKREPHPTQKPLGVIVPFIEGFTDEGDVVVDFFAGSGTTLVACQRLGRRARCSEIEPRYAAVTIQRWVDLTGGNPVCVSDQ